MFCLFYFIQLINELMKFRLIYLFIYCYLLGIHEISSYQFYITLISASIAAFFSSLISQPGDTLLTIVNKSTRMDAVTADNIRTDLQSDTKPKVNVLALMKKSVNELGFKGLFVGTQARLYHVSTILIVQLVVYDYIKQLVGLAATGSH